MSAPRVLVSGVVLSQPMGGVRRHNRELLPRAARLLEERGGALAVMEGRDPVPFDLPASVERFPSDVPASPALARARLEGRRLRAHLERASARGRPFDLVHTAHLPAPRSLPVPYTITLHDLKSIAFRGAPALRRLAGRRVLADALGRAAGVIAVSQTLRAEVLEHFDLDPSRVHVVPNAADHLDPLPRDDHPDALVHVGHIEPRKNLELLLRALHADRELPPLVLAGEPKQGEDERLRRLARELGVEDRLRFMGLLDDHALAELYARAACVVVPSLRESFCIPALEAQRARSPLAISDLPALVEVAGEDVPRFDPADPEACARAVRRAMQTGTGEIEERARRAERFGWDLSAELLVTVWCRAAEGSSG